MLGPLAGRVLETADAAWTGGWFTAGGQGEWGLYAPVHRDPVTGIVLAEVQVSIPRRR